MSVLRQLRLEIEYSDYVMFDKFLCLGNEGVTLSGDLYTTRATAGWKACHDNDINAAYSLHMGMIPDYWFRLEQDRCEVWRDIIFECEDEDPACAWLKCILEAKIYESENA